MDHYEAHLMVTSRDSGQLTQSELRIYMQPIVLPVRQHLEFTNCGDICVTGLHRCMMPFNYYAWISYVKAYGHKPRRWAKCKHTYAKNRRNKSVCMTIHSTVYHNILLFCICCHVNDFCSTTKLTLVVLFSIYVTNLGIIKCITATEKIRMKPLESAHT